MAAVHNNVYNSHNNHWTPWQLPQNLFDLSEEKDSFLRAIQEWVPEVVNTHEPGICLCGKTHLESFFNIQNPHTEQIARIGSLCIKFFNDKVRHEQINNATRFAAVQALQQDPTSSASLGLLEWVKDNSSITLFEPHDYSFYLSVWAKDFDKLSDGQKKWKYNLNKLILNYKQWLVYPPEWDLPSELQQNQ